MVRRKRVRFGARSHFIGAGDLRDLPLAEQIAASVTLRARFVEQDERDTGFRHILNYGHTLGHALEVTTGFALRHGVRGSACWATRPDHPGPGVRAPDAPRARQAAGAMSF